MGEDDRDPATLGDSFGLEPDVVDTLMRDIEDGKVRSPATSCMIWFTDREKDTGPGAERALDCGTTES
ncbi:hypothetical protein EV217_5086 [Phyllobacterium myrsinacearum]|nr:hypothetical protein EV217_5086 [Phyllobacterium myrsinacearum]